MKFLEILKPFRDAIEKDVTIEGAVQDAIYNGMLAYVQDLMLSLSSISKLSSLIFSGPIGSVFLYFISVLLKHAAIKGKQFLVVETYNWHSQEMMKVYVDSMTLINKDIDGRVLTDEEIKMYKLRIKSELKKFYNVGKYLNSK